jgi:hypothetical protein
LFKVVTDAERLSITLWHGKRWVTCLLKYIWFRNWGNSDI